MAEVMLQVKVVPGSSRNRVAGRYGEGVKVQVSAAPEKGKANDAVIDVLAQWLGVRPNQVRIASGHAQPRKLVAVSGVGAGEIKELMEQLT